MQVILCALGDRRKWLSCLHELSLKATLNQSVYLFHYFENNLIFISERRETLLSVKFANFGVKLS